jgi:hypothetical protein
MANTPAKAGSSREQATAVPGAMATPDATIAPRAPAAPRTAPAAPRTAGAPRAAAGHRAARPADSGSGVLAWVPYLIALAGVAAGVALAFNASRDAGRGAGLVGCSLLAAGLARLVLPSRYATILSSRGKTSDVLAFAAFGAAVLAVALSLP